MKRTTTIHRPTRRPGTPGPRSSRAVFRGVGPAVMGCLVLILLAACEAAPTPPSPATPTEYSSGALATATPRPTASTSDATATTPASPQPANVAGFRDQLAVADQFFAALSGVPAPLAGQAYQGWLLADDGVPLSLGMLTPAADGAATLVWNSPNSENLLGRYVRFQITLEPEAGSASPTGKVVFAGGLEGAALTSARRLLVKNDGTPATPRNMAYALGLVAQTDVAAQHVNNAINAAAIGARDEMRAHLEHVVNIIEGMGGSGHGDHDGNRTAEDPGDGFGVIGYAEQVAALVADQDDAAGIAAGLRAQTAAIQENCLTILALDDMTAAAAQLNEVKTAMEQLRADWVARLYQAAQDSVRFDVAPTE